MPPHREHDVEDDDDGMPPLVDNPNPYSYPPPVQMSYTFCNEMTPMVFEMAPPTTIFASPPPPEYPPGLNIYTAGEAEFDDHQSGEGRTSHGKKRDASYIPRPPNAFILFRSSFIKSGQVSNKTESNHSTLSKIIGTVWNQLSPPDRAVWEEKAQVALAEHRTRYPDWRFRPGSNALAKAKVKDRGGGGGKAVKAKNRKKVKEKEEEEGGVKLKTESYRRSPAKSSARRCAKIAELLAGGVTNDDLDREVQAWEDGESLSSPSAMVSPVPSPAQAVAAAYQADLLAPLSVTSKARSLSPGDAKVPLTSMFKRALSVPALATFSEAIPRAADEAATVQGTVEEGGGGELGGNMSPIFEQSMQGHWSDPFDFPMPCPDFSPTTSTSSFDFDFDYECDTPITPILPPALVSSHPLMNFSFVPSGYGTYNSSMNQQGFRFNDNAHGKEFKFPDQMHYPAPQVWTAQGQSYDSYSSYSSLTDWAGAGLVDETVVY